MTTVAENRREAQIRALRTLLHGADQREMPEVKSDINVTPLVDVCLVLLIIFMVVTPLITSGVVVELPRTQHHSRKADEGKDIIVSVTRDNKYYLGGHQLGRPEDLAQAVAAERRRNPSKTVFLKGDNRANYGTVRELMQAFQAIDIEDMILGTEEKKD